MNWTICQADGIGTLPARIGLTPCTCNVIDLVLPTGFFLVFGCLSFYKAKKYYDFVFPAFNCLFRTKLVLSFTTIVMEIVLLCFVSINSSLRQEFMSIVSLATSSLNIVAWFVQTCLMYALHWRALKASWWDLRTFWFVWFLSQCTSMISFANILLSDTTNQTEHKYRMTYFIFMAIQFVCAAGLAILVFLPDDVGDYLPVEKYIPSASQQFSTNGTGRGDHYGILEHNSLNAPFLQRGGNHVVVHSPDRKGEDSRLAAKYGTDHPYGHQDSYSRTQPISTRRGSGGGGGAGGGGGGGGTFIDVMEEHINVQPQQQGALSRSNGSQRGISLHHQPSKSSTTKKKKNTGAPRHQTMKSAERNIWDSFMEHATTGGVGEEAYEERKTATKHDAGGGGGAMAGEEEEDEELLVNQAENQLLPPLPPASGISNTMSSTDHLKNTLFMELPMTVFIPR